MESEVALMNSKASAKELRDTLTSNLEEVSKMEALINNILRLTKLEAEKLQQTFTKVSTATIAEQALKQVEPQAKEKEIVIQKNITDNQVVGDLESLTQLLVILLDNAVKYSHHGKTISISSAKEGDSVSVSVEDKGTGIKRKDLEHVFDRFYRSDSSRTNSAKEGHGLGLSIAKMIADLHNGTITLTSQPGKGTTAIVHLPSAQQK
jgi:signal transduction histidine kinase